MILDVAFCVQFQVHLRPYPTKWKAQLLCGCALGSSTLVCCSSHYSIGGWDVEYLYFQIFTFGNRCVFSLGKCIPFSLKINAHTHSRTLRLDFKYFGPHSFLITNNYYNAKCWPALVLQWEKINFSEELIAAIILKRVTVSRSISETKNGATK